MRRALVALAAAPALLIGCGGNEKLSLHSIPMAQSIHVQAQNYECPVAKEVCFRRAILVPSGRRPVNADTLVQLELQSLLSHRWRRSAGVTSNQFAATAPDGKLFVTFSTGRGEMLDERAGQVTWDEKLGFQLERLTTGGKPALALTVQAGPDVGP